LHADIGRAVYALLSPPKLCIQEREVDWVRELPM
jgi:hypothetical protein